MANRVSIRFVIVCCAFMDVSAVNPPSAKSVAVSKDAAIGVVKEEQQHPMTLKEALADPEADGLLAGLHKMAGDFKKEVNHATQVAVANGEDRTPEDIKEKLAQEELQKLLKAEAQKSPAKKDALKAEAIKKAPATKPADKAAAKPQAGLANASAAQPAKAAAVASDKTTVAKPATAAKPATPAKPATLTKPAANVTAQQDKHGKGAAIREMGFWYILFTWQLELLHCIPVAVVSFFLLSLAVHYPQILDRLNHWHQVRITTAQGKDPKTDMAIGRGVQNSMKASFGTFSL